MQQKNIINISNYNRLYINDFTDYEINYKPIINQENPNKLKKLEHFLTDVSDRMTRDNPLSNYFLSIVLILFHLDNH